MPVHFSPATADSVDALADLAARTFPLACPPDLPDSAISDFVAAELSPSAFSGYLDSGDHEVVIGRAGPRPASDLVAYSLLVAGPGSDPAEYEAVRHRPTTCVSKFYVDPGSHGSGIAGRMLDAVVALCARRGDRSLWLGTNEGNLRAQRFYEKSGFEVVGRRSFVVGGIECTDLIYEKAL